MIDTVIGSIVPILGDYLDYLFKANLRNLETLENCLLDSPNAAQYHILLMPAASSSHKADFIPAPPTKPRFGNLSWGSKVSAEQAESAKRASQGRTRRMLRDEGYAVPVPAPAYAATDGGYDATGTAPAPEASAGRRRRVPSSEPAF